MRLSELLPIADLTFGGLSVEVLGVENRGCHHGRTEWSEFIGSSDSSISVEGVGFAFEKPVGLAVRIFTDVPNFRRVRRVGTLRSFQPLGVFGDKFTYAFGFELDSLT